MGVLSGPCRQVWISVTAFLHLLTLKSQHPAEVADESPEQGFPALEVTRPTDSQSHAETLGTFPCAFFTRKRVRSSDPSTTASIFAPILLRDDIDAALPVSLLGKKKFLLRFMEGP